MHNTVTVLGSNLNSYTQNGLDRQLSKHTHLWQNSEVNTHSWYAPEHWSFSALLTVQRFGGITGTAVRVLLRPAHPRNHTQRCSVLHPDQVALKRILTFPGKPGFLNHPLNKSFKRYSDILTISAMSINWTTHNCTLYPLIK